MVKSADDSESEKPRKKSGKKKASPEPEVVPFWPVVVCDDHISFWAYRFSMIHEDGRIGGHLNRRKKLVDARKPTDWERASILNDIARQRAFCEAKLVELDAAEAALTITPARSPGKP